MAFNFTSLQTPIITGDTVDKNTVSRGIGLLLPFTKATGGIFPISRVTDQQLKVNLLNFIKTRKGERLYHPEFGLSLHSLLFEQMSQPDELRSKIVNSLSKDFSFWLPFVSIRSLDINLSEENTIKIKMSVIFQPSRANYNVVIFIDNSSNVNAEII